MSTIYVLIESIKEREHNKIFNQNVNKLLILP